MWIKVPGAASERRDRSFLVLIEREGAKLAQNVQFRLYELGLLNELPGINRARGLYSIESIIEQYI